MIQSWKEYERQGSITSREEEKEWMQTLLLWHSPFSGCMKFLYTFESYSERVYTLYTGFYCLLWSLISLGITNPSLLVSQIPVCLRGYVSLSCTKNKKKPRKPKTEPNHQNQPNQSNNNKRPKNQPSKQKNNTKREELQQYCLYLEISREGILPIIGMQKTMCVIFKVPCFELHVGYMICDVSFTELGI